MQLLTQPIRRVHKIVIISLLPVCAVAMGYGEIKKFFIKPEITVVQKVEKLQFFQPHDMQMTTEIGRHQFADEEDLFRVRYACSFGIEVMDDWCGEVNAAFAVAFNAKKSIPMP